MSKEIIEKSKLENNYYSLPKINDEDNIDVYSDDINKSFNNKDYKNNYTNNYHYNNYENHYHKSYDNIYKINNFQIILGIAFWQIWLVLSVLYFIVNRRKKVNLLL